MRALQLIVLALTLAGCTSTPHVATQAQAPKPPFSWTAVIDSAGGQGEPSLGVAPDGALFADGLDARGPDPAGSGGVYRSTDGGHNWAFLGAPTAPTPNEDADLSVDKDGTVWFDTLYLACSSTASSRDNGASWTTSFLGCVPPAGDRQYIVATHSGTAYIYSHHAPESYQTIAKTTDYGKTWVPSGIAEGALGATHGQSGWGGGGYWNEAKDSVHFTWTWFDSAADATTNTHATAARPADAHSSDGGTTWTMTQAPNGGGSELGLGLVTGAADKAGNDYLAWGESRGDATTVYLAASRDDGATWSKPMVVDADAGSKVFPAVTALGEGHVAVAYYHADKPGYPGTVPADAAWNVTLAWTSDALAPTPAFQHAALSTHALHKGPLCPDGTLCTTNRDLLDYFALKALPDGRVASVWTSTEDVAHSVVNVFGETRRPVLAP